MALKAECFRKRIRMCCYSIYDKRNCDYILCNEVDCDKRISDKYDGTSFDNGNDFICDFNNRNEEHKNDKEGLKCSCFINIEKYYIIIMLNYNFVLFTFCLFLLLWL